MKIKHTSIIVGVFLATLLMSSNYQIASASNQSHSTKFKSFNTGGGIESSYQIGTFTTSFKVKYLITTTAIFINQKLKNESLNEGYEVLNVNTSYAGLNLASSWEQLSYDYTISNNKATIILRGLIKYNLLIDNEGVGPIFADTKTYKMTINIYTGEALSITEIED